MPLLVTNHSSTSGSTLGAAVTMSCAMSLNERTLTDRRVKIEDDLRGRLEAVGEMSVNAKV